MGTYEYRPNPRVLISITLSDASQNLPEKYAIANIDYAVLNAPHQGRVLAYDRGHEHHHSRECLDDSSPPLCHLHSLPDLALNMANTSVDLFQQPHQCEVDYVLGQFCHKAIEYWEKHGLANDIVSDFSMLLSDPQECRERTASMGN